jgi:hypothetical protein
MKKRLIYFLPIFLFLAFFALKWFRMDWYGFLIQEDGIVEWMQFVFFVLSSLLFFVAFLTKIKTNKLFGIIYLLLSLGFLFISAEEISWGQRVFNVETPEYLEGRNYQNELNFHNIGDIHVLLHFVYIIIGVLGAGLWLLPNKIINKIKLLKEFVPDWSLTFYFLPTAFVYTLIWILDRQRKIGFVHWKDQEPVELILALGFFIYAIFQQRQKQQLSS